MGYTKIIPIKRSASRTSSGTLAAIMYVTSDKIKEIGSNGIDFENQEEIEDLFKVIDYATGDKKLEKYVLCKTITSYINCSADPYLANREMQQVRRRFNKDNDDIVGYHLIQSVEESPEDVDIQKFHDIGVQLATEVFKGFQVTVSTHINTDNIHNHIVINAVNMVSGKKWLDKDATKDLIRKVSDRILQENNFKILEETRDYKKYYRKKRDEKTHLRESDYRNSEAYNEWKSKRIPAREFIKSDIITILPFVKSYDELIERLQELGYQIRYKTKQGDYYKHISFKLPFREKGVRDDRLSEDGYFTRENLTAIIEQNVKEKENDFVNWASQFEKDVEQATLQYSLRGKQYYRFKFDGRYLDELNQKYRVVMGNDGDEVQYRFRSSDDIETIKDIQYYHGLIQEESKQYWENKKFHRENDAGYESYVWQDKRLKYYFDRLKANMDSLSFAEREDFYSLDKVMANIELLYNQRKNIDTKFYAIRKMIVEYGEDVIIINQYRDIMKKLKQYREEGAPEKEIETQQRLAEGYLERLMVRGLESAETQDKLIEKYSNYKERFAELVEGAKTVTEKLKEYDDYMRNMKYINNNKFSGNGCFDEEIERYEYMKEMNRKKPSNIQKANENEKTKNKEMQREKEKGR